MNLLKPVERDTKGKDNDKGRGINGTAEGSNLLPDARHIVHQQNLFDQMPKGTGNGEKNNGDGKKEEIVPENIIRFFIGQLPREDYTIASDEQHQNRA